MPYDPAQIAWPSALHLPVSALQLAMLTTGRTLCNQPSAAVEHHLEYTGAVVQSHEPCQPQMFSKLQPDFCVPQAHKLFSKLQWVGAAVAVFAAAFAAFSFGSGAPLKKLIAPTVLAAIAGALGALARDYREKLEFVDYRCVLLN